MTPRPLRSLRRFAREEEASATVEYVLVFVPLMVMIFFIFEMAMAYHWTLAAQKGVENGVRYAITKPPIHSALLDANGDVLKYAKTGSTGAGDLCLFGANCSSIATVTCTGGTGLAAECDATEMAQIVQVVSTHAYGLAAEDLTITYEESGLGRATEPVIPIVTVTIASRDFPLGLSLFGVDTRLPTVSASLVAENLGN